MPFNETYYDMQLNKLDRTARISIKLVDGAFNETNWLALNKDCKQALLTFLGVRDATYTKGPGSESEDSYNGWKNRETWAAFMWITSTEHLYKHATEFKLNADGLRSMFADVEDGVHSGVNTSSIPMLLDIGSIYRVDWEAIAEALRDEK